MDFLILHEQFHCKAIWLMDRERERNYDFPAGYLSVLMTPRSA